MPYRKANLWFISKTWIRAQCALTNHFPAETHTFFGITPSAMSRFLEYFLFFLSLNLDLSSTAITRGRTGKCRPPLPPYWLISPSSDVSVWPPLLLHRIDQGITPDGASIGLTDICMGLASNGIAIDNRHRDPEISVDLVNSPSVECYCRVDGSVKCLPMNMSLALHNSIFPLICESQYLCTYGIMCDPEDQDSHPRIFENFRDPAYSTSRSPQKFERFCSFAGCRCDPATRKVVCDDLQTMADSNIRPKDIRPCEESCVCSHDDQPIFIPWLNQVVDFDNSLTLPGQNTHEGYL